MELSRILPAFILPAMEAVLLAILYLQRDRGSGEPGVTLRMRWLLVVGIAALLPGTLMLVASSDAPRARLVEVMIISQLFYLPGILLIYGGLMTYLHLPEGADHFLYRTFLGRMYSVRYADCHSYKIEEDAYKSRHKTEVGLSIRATVETPKGKKEKKLSFGLCRNFCFFEEALEEHRVKKEKKRPKK